MIIDSDIDFEPLKTRENLLNCFHLSDGALPLCLLVSLSVSGSVSMNCEGSQNFRCCRFREGEVA